MKSCQIFKTDKSYKIITMYRLESWSYIASNPVFIIPIESNINELSQNIFESLKNSRSLLELEEQDFWLGNKLLRIIKESSYNKLYKNSTSCMIYWQNSILEIEPSKYLGSDKGLEPLPEEVVKIKEIQGEELQIADEVVRILNKTF